MPNLSSSRPIFTYLAEVFPRIAQPADNSFPYPYLTPTPREGIYGGMVWDWDSFLCGYGYLAMDAEKATDHLEGVVHIILDNLGPAGNSTVCINATAEKNGIPQEDPPHIGTIRPVVAQMARLVSVQRGSTDWLRESWPRLKRLVEFYHRYRRHGDLYVWSTGWESPADNNVALWDYPAYGVQACDMSAWVLLEYRAMARLAEQLGDTEATYDFALWESNTRTAILERLWDEDSGSFFNRNLQTGDRIRRHSFTNFAPLWIGLLEPDDPRAREMIERYLLNPEHLWCDQGLRTCSPVDPDYNIEPTHCPSNWRGPVWFAANYFGAITLNRYGFRKEALTVCDRTLDLLDRNLAAHGFVTENFHPDTGENLVAEHFVSWTSIALRFREDLEQGTTIFTFS